MTKRILRALLVGVFALGAPALAGAEEAPKAEKEKGAKEKKEKKEKKGTPETKPADKGW